MKQLQGQLVNSLFFLQFVAFVLWGNHDQSSGKHALVCPEESLKNGWHQEFNMSSHPLIIDSNGDYIADIFGEPFNKTKSSRAIWQFSSSRNVIPEEIYLTSDKELGKMRRPHSNAFVDLDGDGNADLFVTTEDGFELWKNNGGEGKSEFSLHKTILYPEGCQPSDLDGCLVGQSSFFDFDLDGGLDTIVPLCYDGKKCDEPAILFATIKRLWKEGEDTKIFEKMTINLRDWTFDFRDQDQNQESDLFEAVTARAGDVNLDGYPDLLVRLTRKDDRTKFQTHLLLNVPVDVEEEIIVSSLNRGFLLQDKYMAGLNSTSMAAFYDLYENGIEDLITVEEVGDKAVRIGAFTNVTQDSDAYFVKVIVLSGKCFNDCFEDHIKVPYGTNAPGQTICYKTQRPGLEEGYGEIESCAPQLTQTGHSSLQLPYTIFGLGLAPNFLDYMFVNVTNTTSKSKSHTWSQVRTRLHFTSFFSHNYFFQIIPNSQMYVIPHPPMQPNHWEAKLFITPSRGITLTAIALIGTCGLVVVLILILHWRERRADMRDRLQEANRFHFDAM